MTRARDINEIANRLNRDNVLEFTLHTIINFHNLYEAAKTLINEKALYGAGQSLAISALEELGKLFLSAGYLMNLFSADNFIRGVYLHKRKQILGKVMARIAPIITALGEVKKEAEAAISIDEFFANIDKDISDLVETKLSSNSFISEIENILKENLEEQRKNGLYVSIANRDNRNCISHPGQVTEAEAKSILNVVATFDYVINQHVLHGPELKFSSLHESDFSGQVSVDKLKLLIDEMCKKSEHYLVATN